jgi:hypothetical protein
MRKILRRVSVTAVCVMSLVSATTWSAEVAPSALTCADFRPTQEALERFPDLKGACQSVVERDGELYGLFKAIVRRASFSSVTLYLPATDHTFTINPQNDARVLIGGRKVRPRDLARGQEVNIYLLARAFATPAVEQVALVTESDVVIQHEVVEAPALPTTASPWPTVALASVMLLLVGWMIRRRRLAV